jgi:uncharacterized protein YggE
MLLACWAMLVFGQDNDKNFPSMTVTGKSIISQKADNAKIFFSIEAESSTLQGAVAEAKEELSKITKKLKELGLKEDDISTSQFRTTDGFKFLLGLKKFNVIIDAEIKIKDLSHLEAIIFVLSNSKIKEISSIEFGLSNESEVFQQAQINAVKSAKMKASLLAKELDVSIGGIYSVIQLKSEKYSADFNFRRHNKKYMPNPYNSISVNDMELTDSVFSGEIKIISEYEVVFKIINP